VGTQLERPALAELPSEAAADAVALLTDLLLEAASERATGGLSTASASMEEMEKP
jgi:hypothetical protein